jgi:hypothetical protein
VAALRAGGAGGAPPLAARPAAVEGVGGSVPRAAAAPAPATPALLLEESTAPATVILNR